jgi:hypothetical protein
VVFFDPHPGCSGFWEVEVARRSPAQRAARYPVGAAERQPMLDAVVRASAEIGPPDIVVNCFSGANGSDLNGSRYLCEAVTPLLRQQGSGQIVLLAPIEQPSPAHHDQSAGLRSAIIDFARSLRAGLGTSGVKVLCPASKEVRLGVPLGAAGDSSAADVAVDIVIAAMRNHQALHRERLKPTTISWLRRLLLAMKCEASAFRFR